MSRVLISAVLWTLGGVYYGGFLVVALVLSYAFDFRTIDPVLKAMNRGLFRLLFIKVEVEGVERLDPSEPHFFLANHTSLLDVPLVAGFVPGFLRGIEASKQHRWPLYGWVMGRLGNLPIERDSIHGSIGTMKRAEAYLRSGGSLIVFPEGGRSTEGRLQGFKKLPFHLAKRSGKPLVPVTIHGLFQVNNKSSWLIRPGRVIVRFGKVMYPDEYAGYGVLQLRDQVRERMGKALEEPSIQDANPGA